MKFVIIILCAFLLAGCDLFSTRSAEKPNQPRSNYEQPVTPDIVIANLINSFKDKNVENYLSCLTDSEFVDKRFTFSPSSGAVSQFPSLSDNWNKKNEEQYFNNLKSKVNSDLPITLTFSGVSTLPQGDSLVYSASYFLNIPTANPNIPQNYQGDLKFGMIRDSRSTWSIYSWQDSKNSDLPSWSELKGRFY